MIQLPLRSRSPQKHQKSSGLWSPVGPPKRCSPSSLYAFLALAGLGSVLPQFVPQNLPYTDFGGVTVNLPSNSAFWTLGEHRNSGSYPRNSHLIPSPSRTRIAFVLTTREPSSQLSHGNQMDACLVLEIRMAGIRKRVHHLFFRRRNPTADLLHK